MSQRKTHMTASQVTQLQRSWDQAAELLSLLILGARIEATVNWEALP